MEYTNRYGDVYTFTKQEDGSVLWEGGENGRRFMEFSKNRVGQVNRKLYFNFDNGVSFNEQRFVSDIENDELLAEEAKQLETEANSFDRLFGFDQQETEVETEVTE